MSSNSFELNSSASCFLNTKVFSRFYDDRAELLPKLEWYKIKAKIELD